MLRLGSPVLLPGTMATGDMSNDHPVVLGSTLLSEEPDSTLCTLRHGFLPESVKSSGQALLLQSDAKVSGAT